MIVRCLIPFRVVLMPVDVGLTATAGRSLSAVSCGSRWRVCRPLNPRPCCHYRCLASSHPIVIVAVVLVVVVSAVPVVVLLSFAAIVRALSAALGTCSISSNSKPIVVVKGKGKDPILATGLLT